jgi:hypothetical protein
MAEAMQTVTARSTGPRPTSDVTRSKFRLTATDCRKS